ncbi:MAG: MFS transporter, partial [Deltaproteobacteria bacterium]
VNIYKWTISTLSLLPQSILLGMTFPLMSGAFLRFWPHSSGRSLAILYFANSIGAVFGVLASGFLFIGMAGFPGTISIAGIINIILALVVWSLSRNIDDPVSPDSVPDQISPLSDVSSLSLYRRLLLISLVTGTSSFIYEIGWIRMLALVLGSSTHAFELMLAAFLLGLATGGFWIKQRIDTLKNPILFLAIIQIAMGIAALATLPLYNSTFPIMQWLMNTLPKTDNGYLLFNLSSYGIAATIMLPATFCAGMTLPLITNILFREGNGEKSIGAVYAANTVGAIIGIFSAVHLMMPSIGLKGLLVTGAALDMTLAVILVATATDAATRTFLPRFAGICIASVTFVLLTVQFDQYNMASGIYRTGVKLLKQKDEKIIYYQDGKTATISVTQETNGFTSIRTNGKSDSAISLNMNEPATLDEPTTILSGVLPLFYKPDARSIAVIGLGTGLTTQTVLTSPKVRSVDTIEIEKGVVEGAQQFRSRTDLIYSDQRSKILIDDAKSVFSSHGNKYDVIISEPSNPWVSGISGLFSDEFYRHIQRYLEDDGLFVQWLQLYDMDMPLVVSVFKALMKNFSDYTVYLTAGNVDLMIVAKKNGLLGALRPDVFQIPAFRSALERIRVKGLQDIRIREVGSKNFLEPLFLSYQVPGNSDYYPFLDQNAAKARFMGAGAYEILRLANGPIPYMHLISQHAESVPSLSTVSVNEGSIMTLLARRGASVQQYLLTGMFPKDAESDDRIVSPIVRTTVVNLRRMFQECSSFPEAVRKELLSTAAVTMLPYLTEKELEPVWNELEKPSCRASMSDIEKQYLALFKAIGAKDFKRVSVLARDLLAHDAGLPQNTRMYLVGIGMLAFIADGNRADSLRLYQKMFGTRGQSDIIFRMLYA